ncbi:6-phospho-beta-glucosidase GmuD [bioreactor metagenome]|uniref:6-phospho-beta-glucosidase GmuD n=1 Tax=bioreactor metagenome TaxID=1076179 RepID=A0A645DFW5_9ZZZZ
MYDLLYNRIFLDPLVKGEYPDELFDVLAKHAIPFEYSNEELLIIKENTVDYLGINLYFPKRVRSPRYEWNKETPFHPEYYYEEFSLPGRRMNTSRGWEIFPQIMYDMAMRLKSEYGNIPWFVAESGMGIEQEERFADSKGTIQDDYRISYISEHLSSLLDAVHEGANCNGYMLWAFTDCVSPMNAFKNRYGLVRIDLEDDKKRSLKQSGYWYRDLIQSKRLEVVEHTYK